MEAERACRLCGRSLQKHKMRFIPFVRDGDSKSYWSINKSNSYGPGVFIPEDDWIGYDVTKRMDTAL